MLAAMKELSLSRKWTLLVLFILYVFTLGIRIYWFSQKNTFHLDETASVQRACGNTWTYENNRGYTGKEAKEVGMLCRNNMFEDIYHLWQDNNDSSHTNLYYSLFRLSLGGIKSVDIQQIIFRGGALNILLFTVSFIFFFLLMRLLFPGSPLLQLAATACAFLSTAAISNTLFLRPYQIQETSFIVLCYYFFKTFDFTKHIIHDGKLYINFRLLILLAFVTAFSMLTGYFAVVFVGLLGLYALYDKNKSKKSVEILFYMAVMCLAVVFSQTLYLKYLYGYFSIRATDAGHLLTDHLFSQRITLGYIKFTLLNFRVLVMDHFFTYPILILCALCVLLLILYRKQRVTIPKYSLYIFVASMIYAFIILFLAPWKALRYIMPIFPFFILFPSTLIYFLGKQKISAILMLLFLVFFSLGAFSKDRIEHISNPDIYTFRYDPAVPVFIFNKTPERYMEIVSWLNDNQMYYFNFSGAIDLDKTKEVYIVVDTTPEMSAARLSPAEFKQNFLSLFFSAVPARKILSAMNSPQIEIEPQFMSQFFTGVKIRAKK